MKTSTKTWLLAVAAAAMLAFPPRALATGGSGFRASSPPDAQWITHSSTSVYNTDWNSGHWATGDLGVITLPASAQFTVTVYGSGNGGGLFWATLRGSLIFTTDSPNDATIVVRFPGPVTEANATTVTNATARWQAPIARYFSWDGIPMVARFTATPKQVASAPRP